MKPDIDHASPVPLYHQIAEALRGAIEAGEIAPGDALEPMRRAAETWGVHLHTVRHAYAALAREGLVELKRGPLGTRVLGAARRSAHSESRRSFLDRVASEAFDLHGLTAADLAAAFSDRAASHDAPFPYVYVVECSERQCRCHARQIESRFRVEARIWPLCRSEPPDGAVISTYFHYNDIRKLWPRRFQEVCFLTIFPDPRLKEELAGASRLRVFERDPSTADAIAADLVALFGGESVEVEPRVLADVAELSLGGEGEPPALFPPRVWADLPPEIQRHARALELRYVLDSSELADLGRSFRWLRRDDAAA